MPQLWPTAVSQIKSDDSSLNRKDENSRTRKSVAHVTETTKLHQEVMETKKEIANLRVLLYTDMDQLLHQHCQNVLENFTKSHQQVVKLVYDCMQQEKVVRQPGDQRIAPSLAVNSTPRGCYGGIEGNPVVQTQSITGNGGAELFEVQHLEDVGRCKSVTFSGAQAEKKGDAVQQEWRPSLSLLARAPDEDRLASKGLESECSASLAPRMDKGHSVRSDYRSSLKRGSTFVGDDPFGSEEVMKAKAQQVAKIRNSTDIVDEFDDLPPTGRERVRTIVTSVPFEVFISLVVLTNLLFVGVQVEWSVAHPNEPVDIGIQIIEYLYLVVFFGELVARLFADGCTFFYDKQWAWNWIDFIIVLFSLLELASNLADTTMGANGNMTYLRIVRIARTMRVIRVVRIMRFFRALRILVYSILCTLKSLFWTVLLLILTIYVFGIVFVSSTGEHLALQDEFSDADHTLKQLFGSIPRALFTLFKCVTNGQDWSDVSDPLSDVHWILVMLFVIYITFTYFAVLNVVTGVFCQSAIESAQLDQDMVVQAQIARKEEFVSKLKKLFEDIDKKNMGTLTLAEFEDRLKDDQVAAFFATLELEVSDAWTLFKLLDTDESHVIHIEDFVEGCLKLKGQAKSIDIAKMMYENQWMMKKLENFMRYFEEQVTVAALPEEVLGDLQSKDTKQDLQVVPILYGDLQSKDTKQDGERQHAWSAQSTPGEKFFPVAPTGGTPVLPMHVSHD